MNKFCSCKIILFCQIIGHGRIGTIPDAIQSCFKSRAVPNIAFHASDDQTMVDSGFADDNGSICSDLHYNASTKIEKIARQYVAFLRVNIHFWYLRAGFFGEHVCPPESGRRRRTVTHPDPGRFCPTASSGQCATPPPYTTPRPAPHDPCAIAVALRPCSWSSGHGRTSPRASCASRFVNKRQTTGLMPAGAPISLASSRQSICSLPRNRYAAMVCDQSSHAPGMLAVGRLANRLSNSLARRSRRGSPRSRLSNSSSTHAPDSLPIAARKSESKRESADVYNPFPQSFRASAIPPRCVLLLYKEMR